MIGIIFMCVYSRAYVLNSFQFSSFSSKFHIYTLGIKNPSLDPEFDVVAYGAEVTRLGAIGHAAEVGSQGWCGW